MGSSELGVSDWRGGLGVRDLNNLLDRESALERSLELKGEGYTVREIVKILGEEGYVNVVRGVGRAYGFWTVGEWCRGFNKQSGKRKPGLYGLSEGQRLAYNAEMRERRLRRMRSWRLRNREHCESYSRWYRSL